MNNPTLACLAGFCLLAGACSDPSTMTVKQLTELQQHPVVSNPPMNLKLIVRERGKPEMSLGETPLRYGKSMGFENRKEFIYPSEYESPEAAKDGQSVIPATPAGFESTNTGFEAKLSASRRGSLVIIEGSITSREFQGFSAMGGEIGRPIIDANGKAITENRVVMPMFATFSTPVFLAVKPGKDYSFAISGSRKGGTATLRLDPQ